MSKPSGLRPKSINDRITHLLKHWPSDPVRPASVSMQNYLQSHLSQTPKGAAQQQQSKPAMSEASFNALSSLLGDRYAKRYPLPQKLRYPASNPDHYDNVIREFEEAPNRDWWGRLRKRLTGLFRFS